MEKEKAPDGHCRRCGKDVAEDQIYCSTCIVELAEESIPDYDAEPQKKQQRVQSPKKILVLWCILLACILVIAFQLPGLLEVFKEKQPIRQGTYQTSAKTDQCINNLWQISRLLQDGIKPGADIRCPASGSPYLILEKNGNITAQCPNPDLHGFSSLSVSKDSPRPEVTQ